ncbi:Regulatory protein, FmdB family [Desulfamplus magnetovallimortis]|uniref:Regulatory protein, FmdB family n=1 Tax=Desulfamplus magnetovallimortis TaxID=1246637 RepID=A0A1W1H5M3_9BACT|nr:zinc ribbon domain-containing protein [Desulfamplus magnetovallimortis]SLM27747.1 Regulatory protein, FmdB family [Desulfamplus magnetovallimortis]
MPIFEYKCNGCKKDFELLVIGSQKPLCPSCSSPDLVKLMSACGFFSKTNGPGNTVQTTSSAGSACSGCAATSCSTCGSR